MVSSALASARRAAALLARGARAARAPASCASAASATSSRASRHVPASAPRSFAGAPRAFAASADLAGAPMYTPTHEIVRPRALPSAPSLTSTSGEPRDAFVLVRVGLADRAFDEIGDVKAITRLAETGKRVSRGETVGVLKWEGFKRTASDELYHAVWANATGDRDFTAPFDCDVVAFNEKALADPYKVVCGTEKGWIVEVRVTRAEIRAAVNDGHLLSEKQYAEVCDAQEREQDAAASRAYP